LKPLEVKAIVLTPRDVNQMPHHRPGGEPGSAGCRLLLKEALLEDQAAK